MVPVGEAPFTIDAAKVHAGANYYIGLQCSRCHGDLQSKEVTDISVLTPNAKPLAQLRARQPSGCIAPNPKGNTAKYEITDRQRMVIQSLLQLQEVLATQLTPDEEIKTDHDCAELLCLPSARPPRRC
jgi:hypothetical protein